MFRSFGVGVFMMAALVLSGCAGPNGEPPTATAAAPSPEPSVESSTVGTPNSELTIGDCLDRDRVLVSCDEEHFFEVHLVLTLPDPPGTPYPGRMEVLTRVAEASDEAILGYFGGTPEAFGSGGGGLTKDEWNDGERLIVWAFYVTDTGGDPLPVTGSLKGAFGEDSG